MGGGGVVKRLNVYGHKIDKKKRKCRFIVYCGNKAIVKSNSDIPNFGSIFYTTLNFKPLFVVIKDNTSSRTNLRNIERFELNTVFRCVNIYWRYFR